jgi:hypothetical protein
MRVAGERETYEQPRRRIHDDEQHAALRFERGT